MNVGRGSRIRMRFSDLLKTSRGGSVSERAANRAAIAAELDRKNQPSRQSLA